MALHEVDLFHLTSYADVIRKTQAFAENSKDEWIIGDGWDQNLWPSRAFPTHEALTQALPNRPVIPPFPGGRIIRDASGNPTLTSPPTTKSAAPPSPPSANVTAGALPPSATRA